MPVSHTASPASAPGAQRAAGERSNKFEGLHVLADDDPRWRLGPVEQAHAACEGGAAVVQLRVKHATDREALRWGEAIREATRRAGVRFVMNDRFDLALALGADAVHLGQEDLPPARVRAAAGPALAIGRSTHDDVELVRAQGEPVDYVAFGPVFGTSSKQTPHAARGLERLAAAAAQVQPRPLVAIGGIDLSTISAVIATGARGVAVLSAVAGAADPVQATRRLVQALEACA
jgi:thiamine-phosphate pyrophosphorylase